MKTKRTLQSLIKLGKKIGPRRYKVRSKLNSDCTVQLESLDWNNWFTDGLWHDPPSTYLHVHHKGTKGMEGTIHRVYCKKGRPKDKVRLMMKDGELYWLVDKKG